ncbi:AAA family ATPase [Streptomyces capitiformicae]|uniref:LuxR family transcriptional regulator n=1 Tax=Streptomyces capitiformicae TaxID=2014920 RepID=A0A919DJB0_9ACTN|nr:LuxR family transcriptional regulator [Streptomyces capitiformicae]GHE48284.1 LuxR family transcriptional regulator [Streptomyces capitiformicae]
MLEDRSFELRTLDDVLGAASTGSGTSAVVSGPIGIGRSELLDTLAEGESADVFRVLRAVGSPMEEDHAFGVVRQLFDLVLDEASPATLGRWWAGTRADVEPLFADGAALPDTSSLSADRWEAVLHGLATMTCRMGADRPTLLLVDDLHWADDASLAWLNYLAKRVSDTRVAIVATVQEGSIAAERQPVREFVGSADHSVRPGALSVAGVVALVDRWFGEPGDDAFVLACREVTGGNPLFVTEVLAELAALGHRPTAEQAPAARRSRPAALRERLPRYLACLGSAQLRLIRAAALLHETVDAGLARSVAGLEAPVCDESERGLRRLGLLTYDLPYRFTHPSVREAVAESMTAAEEDELRVRAARLLHADSQQVETAAEQLTLVAAPQGRWAVGVLRQAARTALAAGRPEAAAAYLRRALLDTPADGGERGALLACLGIAEREFDPSAAVRHLIQAVPLQSSPGERAAVAARLSPMVIGNSLPHVRERLRLTATDLGPPDRLPGPLREVALSLEARCLYLDLTERPLLEAGAERLRALGPDVPLDTVAERELAAVLLYAAVLTGRTTAREAARLSERILEREPATPDHVHSALPLVVFTLAAADAPDLVAPWLERAGGSGRGPAGPSAHPLGLVEEAWLLRASGKPAPALARALEAVEAGGVGLEHCGPTALIAMGDLALETDDAGLAARLRQCLSLPGRQLSVTTPVERFLSGVEAAVGGDLGDGVQQIVSFGRLLERLGWNNPALIPWRAVAAELHWRSGEQEQALPLIEEVYGSALAWGAPATLGRVLRIRGEVQGGEEGVALLHESARMLEDSADRWELSKAHHLLGRQLQALSDPKAEEHLRYARELADECGMGRPARRVRTPAGPEPRTLVPATGTAVLTATELRVARLAARGRTNQEIARDAGVTSRAVEKALTKVYRKLGIQGRAGLTEALRPPADVPG